MNIINCMPGKNEGEFKLWGIKPQATAQTPHPNPLPKGEGACLPSPCRRGAGGKVVRGGTANPLP